MKTINRTDQGEPITDNSWPKHTTKSVETRKRDLVIRITNWLDDKDEPAFDVEVYNQGAYDFELSQSFCLSSGQNRPQARNNAIEFAKMQIDRLVKRIKPFCM